MPSVCRRCGRLLSGADPAPASSGLGTPRNPAPRHRISTAPARLLLRLLHLRRIAPRRPHRASRAAADRLRRPAHGLLPPVQTPGRQFLSLILHQPASSGWMVALQNRAAEAVRPAYDELAEQLPEQARPAHRRIADQGRPSQGLGLDLRRRDLHLLRLPHQPGRRRAQATARRRLSPASSTATGPGCTGPSAACSGAGPI